MIAQLPSSNPVAAPAAIRWKKFAAALGNSATAIWKLLAGGALCQGVFGSILVVGWTFRLAQRLVLRQWWKQSGSPSENISFENFVARMPAHRQHQHWPNWILEQNRAWLSAPSAPGWSKIRATCKALSHSLWQNLKLGLQAIFNTWVFTLPGCLLMLFSWYAGWQNSFNKGYEQAAVGPLTGFAGIFLFIAAMYYVPMAQIRQASTGDWRSFYQFKVVWQLIRRRWLACLGLALLYAALSLPVTILKTLPAFFPQINPALVDLSPAEALAFAKTYYFYAGFAVFISFVLLRVAAARIYASSLLACVQSGAMHEESLAENEWEALHHLDLMSVRLRRPRHFLVETLAWFGTKIGRVTVGVAIFLVWFAFVSQVYVSEFFNRSEYSRGWLNQPLVQLPWFNYIPNELEKSAPRDQ